MAKDTALVRIGLESNQYEKGLRQAQKQWQDFTKSLGMNIGKLTAVGVAASAVTGALKVMKDAFFKNEQQLDEWNRSVESAKSVYSGFLNSLNNGNISGFLSNMSSIVQAARDAYDALDDLNTFNAFSQMNFAKARANLSDALADYKEGTGSKESVKSAGNELIALLNERAQREQNTYTTAVAKIAKERGVNAEQLQRILESSSYDTLLQYKNLPMTGKRVSYQGFGMPGQLSKSYVAAPATPQEELGEMLRQFNDEELKELQAKGTAAFNSLKEISDTRRQIARYLGGNTTGGAGGSVKATVEKETYTPLAGSIDAQVQKVKELQDAFNAAGSDGIRMGLLPQLKEAEQTLERMRNLGDFAATTPTGIPGTELSPIAMPTFDDSAREKAAALAKIAEQNREAWQAAAGAIGQVGQALQMIEDPAIKVAGIIAEAIANIALSFSQAMLATGKTAPWAWLAFAATGTATMISTIAAIKQATAGSYATGGIVPGNHFSGDMQTARVNAGELILNQAQQGVLASRLQQGSLPNNLQLSAVITGEQIRLVLNNNGRRTLAGEYLTTKMHRP